jgi:hypothetical protein
MAAAAVTGAAVVDLSNAGATTATTATADISR